MTELYISVDVEASGPYPPEYSMLSLGACVVTSLESTFYVELQPITVKEDPDAMAVVGRPLSDFQRSGIAAAVGMQAFAEWITEVSVGQVPVFVAFNATFDWAFVNWYFLKYLNHNPFGIGGLDIKSYYMGVAGVSWERTRASQLPKSLQFSEPKAHHALQDAVQQAKLFQKMLKPTTE